MYYTDLCLPMQTAYNVERTIPGSANYLTAQQTDAVQTREIQIFCATLQEINDLTTTLQADSGWMYEVSANVQPIANGIDRFTGSITCKRWLRLASSDADVAASDSSGAASYTVFKS